MARERRKSQYSLALQQVQTETASQPNSEQVEQRDSQPAQQQTSETASQPNSKPARQQRIKATFYLAPADIIAIDKMQIARFEKGGKKPEKSELVSEAIQLLFEQPDS